MTVVDSHPNPRDGTWPTTGSGRWSVWSFGVLLLGAAALVVAAASGQTGGETIFDNLWLGIPGIVGLIGATVSMVTGLFALFRLGDRSTSVILASTGSTLAFLFVALSLALG